MKFFGWDFLRSYRAVLNKRPMARFTRSVEKSLQAYEKELGELVFIAQRGDWNPSGIISSYCGSQKPYFLRRMSGKNKMKLIEIER